MGLLYVFRVFSIHVMLVLSALCQEEINIPVHVKRLGNNALMLRVEGAQATNIVALNSRKGIVVIDTETSPSLAALARKRIEQEFGRNDFAYVINTHDHGDHTYGNQVFPDVVIIGHEACGEEMRRGSERRMQTVAHLRVVVERMKKSLATKGEDSATVNRIAYYDLLRRGLEEEFVLTPPTLTFDDTMTLDLGDYTLGLYHYGLSHSKTDILVHCPEMKMLITGDLFARGYDPYVDSERIPVMSRWLRNLDRVAEMELAYIIPGHGGFLEKEELARTRHYIVEEQKKYVRKESAFARFKAVHKEKGMPPALESLRAMKARPEAYFMLHSELDSFAFRLMMDGNLDDALPLFHLLAEYFPESDISFDSLGEAYLKKGDKKLAAKYFKQCLDRNPENGNARRRLDAMEP